MLNLLIEIKMERGREILFSLEWFFDINYLKLDEDVEECLFT